VKIIKRGTGTAAEWWAVKSLTTAIEGWMPASNIHVDHSQHEVHDHEQPDCTAMRT
jgi:hypothetical protein